MADPSTYRPPPGTIPDAPGVYRFRDAHRPGDLRRQGQEPATAAQLLLRRSVDACTRVPSRWSPRPPASTGSTVGTEVEALQLEYTWIKEYDPRFNVRYRDDKSLPVPRGHPRRGVPAAPGDARCQAQGRALLRAVLARLGHPRDARPAAAGLPGAHLLAPGCSSGTGQIGRPCLLGYIGKCSAPCVGRVDADGAPAHRRGLLRLHGRPHRQDGCAGWSGRCGRPPTDLEFERAARLRDDLAALRRAMEKQAVVLRRRHRRRRGGLRRGPAGGRGPGLPRARRPGPRPARLGGGEDRGAVHRRPRAPLLHPGLRRRDAGRAPTCRARCWCPALPADADALADWLSEHCAAAGSRCGCRSAATRRR